MSDAAATARAIWQAGVDAVDGHASVSRALHTRTVPPPDRILAVGKAAAAMTRAALDFFGPLPALVVTKDGHGQGLPGDVEVIEAAHPVPNERSLAGGRALRRAVADMPDGSRLLLLVSGGASSLAEDLLAGKSLDDLAALNGRLLADGLDITAMNAERRKISLLKGGGLLAGFGGAAVEVLAISDVPGDDIAVIGSGIGAAPENAAFAHDVEIVAANAVARQAAVDEAERRGLAVLHCAEGLHDPLPDLATTWGPRLRTMGSGAIILGGEPTVVLPETPGRGGRNQALALALAEHIAGTDVTLVVGGTDGTDGPTEDAGGVVDGSTWGPGAAGALARADSGHFLADHGALLTTGPTGTNVMDLLVAVRL